MIFTTNKPLNEWGKVNTTKIWQRPSLIGFSSAGALSTSMDPPGEPVISTWKRPCQKIQNGSEFPEPTIGILGIERLRKYRTAQIRKTHEQNCQNYDRTFEKARPKSNRGQKRLKSCNHQNRLFYPELSAFNMLCMVPSCKKRNSRAKCNRLGSKM